MTSETMISAGAIMQTGAIFLALGFLAATSSAFVEASSAGEEGGGLLYIPSNTSLAHCPSSCGDVDISYPFGIGTGCFRQGFELFCDHTAQPPKLFLGNSTTEITYLDQDLVWLSLSFNLTMEPGVNTSEISWVAPAKGITSDGNYFYAVGCDFDVNLFDYQRKLIGSCMSRCQDEKVMPDEGPCNGIGCCFISITDDMAGGFHATFVRAAAGTQSQPKTPHPARIIAIVSNLGSDYQNNVTKLFSDLTNTSNFYHALFSVAITNQPNCRSALRNNKSYACAAGSACIDASHGYNCF